MKSNRLLMIVILLCAFNAKASDVPPELEVRFSPLMLSTAIGAIVMRPMESLLLYVYTKPPEIAQVEKFRADLIRDLDDTEPTKNSVHAVVLTLSSLLNRFSVHGVWRDVEQDLFTACIEYLKKFGQGVSLAREIKKEIQTLKDPAYTDVRFRLQKPLDDLLNTVRAKPSELPNFFEVTEDLSKEQKQLVLKRALAIEQELRKANLSRRCRGRLGDNDNTPLPRE